MEDDSLGNLYAAFENHSGKYKDPTGQFLLLVLKGAQVAASNPVVRSTATKIIASLAAASTILPFAVDPNNKRYSEGEWEKYEEDKNRKKKLLEDMQRQIDRRLFRDYVDQFDKPGPYFGFGANLWDTSSDYSLYDESKIGFKADNKKKIAQEIEISYEVEETVSIFKAPQPGKGVHQYVYGYKAEDFPIDLPYYTGEAFFAKDRDLAEKYAYHYREGIIEIKIPKSIYEERIKQYEQAYHEGPYTEIPLPHWEFDVLNEWSERVWHK